MKVASLLLPILLSISPLWGSFCKRDFFKLDLSSQEPTKAQALARLVQITAEKTQITKRSRVLFLSAKRRFQYCLPKATKEESPLCRMNDEVIKYNDDEMTKALNAQRCLVGETCKEYECRGAAETSVCFHPKLNSWADEKEVPFINKASSLLYGTCVQYWGCSKRLVEVDLHLTENLNIRFADPIMGSFLVKKGEITARGEEAGVYAKIMDEISISSSTSLLTCIKNSGSHLCYNQEDRTVFSVGINGRTCVGPSCFRVERGLVESEEEIAGLGEVPTQYDLTRLYRLVQFQSLQTIWDIEQIQARAARQEKVLGRVITSLLEGGLGNVLMRSLVGVSPGSVKGHPPVLEVGVCRENFSRESYIKEKAWPPIEGVWFKQNSTRVPTAKLFLDPKMSLEEVPRPSFEVDKLTYHDISKLTRSLAGEADGVDGDEKESSFWGNNIYWTVFTRIGALLGWLFMLRLVFQGRGRGA